MSVTSLFYHKISIETTHRFKRFPNKKKLCGLFVAMNANGSTLQCKLFASYYARTVCGSLVFFNFARSKCTQLDLSHKHHRMYAKLLENSIAVCFVYILVFVPHIHTYATHLKRTQRNDFDETGRCFWYFPLFYDTNTDLAANISCWKICLFL